MAVPQPGIFAQGTRSHYHLEFDVRPGATDAEICAALDASRGVAAALAPVATSDSVELIDKPPTAHFFFAPSLDALDGILPPG
jgi:hypothetical protein